MASKKKPKSNTRITAKEAKLKAQIARSKAAKKGWKTRRKNQLVEKVKNTKKQADSFNKLVPKKKRTTSKLPSEKTLKKQTNKQLIKELRGELDRIKALPQDVVRDAYWTKRDGQMAKHPSIVRMLYEDMREGPKMELDDDFDRWVDNGQTDKELHDIISFWVDWFHDEYPDWDIPLEDFYAFFKS